jgi:hypothetical protein
VLEVVLGTLVVQAVQKMEVVLEVVVAAHTTLVPIKTTRLGQMKGMVV